MAENTDPTSSPTPEQVQEIADALAARRKIEAIKIYRAATGKGLKEAKDFIDALVPQLVEQDPEKYKALSAPKSAGCASVLVVCFGLGIAATVLVKAIG